MLTAYPACFFKEEPGYSVVFPDLNYLATCGDTLTGAFSAAVDCLAGYLYTAQRGGEDVPPPSDMRAINPAEVARALEADPGESFVNMITVDVNEYARAHFEKSVKKTLSIPAWLNAAALEKGINFSQALQGALMDQLGLRR